MVEFFEGRRLRYQICLQIEGRWQIVAVIDDERDQLARPFLRSDLDQLETEIRSRAHAALATQGATAVKVIRERIRADGFTLEEPFLLEQATPVKPAEKQIANYSGPIPVCTSFNDFLTRPALRTIGMILRPLLDRLGMTPIELVTLKAVNSPVKRAQDGIYAAISLAARLQAEAIGVPIRNRVSVLENLAEECRTRVRAANLGAVGPKLGTMGLDRFIAALAQAYPAKERRFRALRGLADYIAEPTSYPAKLDRLLSLNQPQLGPEATDLLDEMVACLVDHQNVVHHLLGHQADLRVALLRLMEFAEGLVPIGSVAPEAAAQMALLIEQGQLVKTRDALWDRLTRSLAGHRMLTAGSLKGEQAAIAELTLTLDRFPEPYQAVAKAALTRRQTMVLQTILDEMEH